MMVIAVGPVCADENPKTALTVVEVLVQATELTPVPAEQEVVVVIRDGTVICNIELLEIENKGVTEIVTTELA